MRLEFLDRYWDLPAGVAACRTLAGPGGDLAATVAGRARREALRQTLGVGRIAFLQQVHGVAVHRAEQSAAAADSEAVIADAGITRAVDVACVVLTADCLPVLFCAADGSEVAAAHAGWRGLAAGVLEATLAAFEQPAGQIRAWLGAAIGPDSFEVGPEVRAAFLAATPAAWSGEAASCFRAGRGDRYWADLYALARWRLRAAGVHDIQGGGEDTFADGERWYSYRRDGTAAGRQATLIWRTG